MTIVAPDPAAIARNGHGAPESAPPPPQPRVATGLRESDFTRIAANGFGDGANSYAHSMVRFGGDVYVGTSRHALPLLKLFPPRDAPAMDPWPVPTPARVEDLDLRGEIWRLRPASGSWDLVHRSPEIESQTGGTVPRELGYRGMAAYQGRSDSAPALYASSISSVARGTGARLLRSGDGGRFEPVGAPGLGNPRVSSFRSLVEFGGRLYVAPAGEGTTWNNVSAPVILGTDDPVAGDWQPACEPGFGDPTNAGIFELAVFDGHLYAGTFNSLAGYQVWKGAPDGEARLRWSKVLDGGAGRGPLNEMAMSLCPFGGALYVGSGVQNGGYDRNDLVGPAAAELVRVRPDGSWELLVGTTRRTPDGVREPLTGRGPGFDNVFGGYLWRMVEHDGWLYASTFDWSVFLPYATRPPGSVRKMMREIGVDRMVEAGGGFELWRTRDGVQWAPVTRTGFSNHYNHGGRNLLSTPEGLMVGTANPFGPQVAARTANGWVYVDNPDGGAEVWLGDASDDDPRPAPGPTHLNGRRKPDVLVTGGSGFIGAHVLEELLARGAGVRVLALEETVDDIRERERVDVVVGGLGDGDALAAACAGIRTVFHLGALLPGASRADLDEVNVRGTDNLLRACGDAGTLERFVFTSSVAVYKDPFTAQAWPLSESAALGGAGSESLQDYGRSKVAAEAILHRRAADDGFAYTVLRPSTCYGAGSARFTEFVERVLSDPRAGRGPFATRPLQLVHVRDLARLIADAAESPSAVDETFNVAGFEALGFADAADIVRELAGVPRTAARWAPNGPGQWRRYLRPYDVLKAQRLLGFTPGWTMYDGLAEIVGEVVGERQTGRFQRQEGGRHARLGARYGWNR